MEKISGILPASPRTKVAEVSSAQPARPGAPAFGRPMGRNSLGDRITLSKELERMKETGVIPEPATPATYKNPAEANKLKIIDELNAKFFTNPKEVAKDTSLTRSEQTLKSVDDNTGFTAPAVQPRQEIHDLQESKGDKFP